MHVNTIRYVILAGILICGLSGVVSAASDYFSPGFITDPSFLSPDWKVTPITTSYSDPTFLSKDWAVPNLNNPNPASSDSTLTNSALLYTDPSFFSPGWKVPEISPIADPGFLNKNWSTPRITPYADSNFLSGNWSVPDISKSAPFYQVYIYNPGSSTPFTVPDQSQKNSLPSYDPFASNPGPGWISTGNLFGP